MPDLACLCNIWHNAVPSRSDKTLYLGRGEQLGIRANSATAFQPASRNRTDFSCRNRGARSPPGTGYFSSFSTASHSIFTALAVGVGLLNTTPSDVCTISSRMLAAVLSAALDEDAPSVAAGREEDQMR